MLTSLISSLIKFPGLKDSLKNLGDDGNLSITGGNLALASAISILAKNKSKRPLLVITPNGELANQCFLNLSTFSNDDTTMYSPYTWQEEGILPNLSINLERMETLSALMQDSKSIVVAPCLAFLQSIPSPAEFNKCSVLLKCGQEHDLYELITRFVDLGYERTDMVEFRGEFSVRGGIIDVYPITADYPFRLEFFGDEITSLRSFEIHSQRSVASQIVDQLIVPAVSEASIRAVLQSQTEASLLDYFKVKPIVIWHEFSQTIQELARWQKEKDLPDIIKNPGLRFSKIRQQTKDYPSIYFQDLQISIPDFLIEDNIEIQTSSLSLVATEKESYIDENIKPYQYNLYAFAERLKEWREKDYQITISCSSDSDKNRLMDLLQKEVDIPQDWYQIVTAVLSSGWIIPKIKSVLVSDDEIFQRIHTRRRRARRIKQGKSTPINNIASIAEGEYVVHINHGVGQFEGIKVVDLDNLKREMILVRYAEDALLYVPLGQAHLIELYVTVGSMTPQLDSLGSSRWSAKRRKAEKAVLDLAAELLERQAQRQALKGYSFSPDSEWQLAFEKSFPYAATPDQATAINEVKTDMELGRPMDRLICGDVGFGKTEVAIRAAFKAVLDGKQVAMLVPTTILAQQHWHTFYERMADYPVRVEVLSRFVPPKQQKQIIKGLAEGKVDIVIGTHRLISKDMVIPQLGMVIIDEEQRFGVRHKEKLKKLRAMVDVLALSATPVPRTLYQSLTGARDMSTILTPPEDRAPVKTLLIKNDKKIIREAILRELARGGQVFYLHNRVETIDDVAEKLQDLVPSARISVGHGQMPEKELSQTIDDFTDHKFDVLVCTMIIEAGVDISNANTIIIDNAQMFGLADLYQLRGRVGRASRQAYAYLVVPNHLSLDSIARHRLKAILENTSLGSGYAIAMKDLEIRGAGNLLGPEQSGHIASIGFNLYCKMLQRTVELLKAGKLDIITPNTITESAGDQKAIKADWRKELPTLNASNDDIEIHIPFAGNIPEEYLESAALRLDLFRRIGGAKSADEIINLEAEMRDRFGALPEETILALRIAEARNYARERGINMIEVVDNKIILRRNGKILSPTDSFPRIIPKDPMASMNIILAYISRLEPVLKS